MIKRFFYLSLILVISEGVLRKWLLPSLSIYIYALKYIFVLFLVVLFFLSIHSKHLKKTDYQYITLWLVFIMYLILTSFLSNASATTLIIGFLAYFGFVIYMFVVPVVIVSHSQVYSFLNNFFYFSVVVFCLGIIQFYLPPGHFINTYANEHEYISTVVTGEVRITSVFNYITGNTTFLSLAIPVIFVLSLTEKRKFKRYLFAFVFFLGFFNVFATGSRLPVASIAISILLLVIYIYIKGGRYQTNKFTVLFLSIIFFLILFNSIGLLNLDSFISFFSRVNTTSDSSVGRVLWMFKSIYDAYEVSGLVGYGIGTTSNIVFSLGENIYFSENINPAISDQPMGRMIIEIGIVGFVLYLLLTWFIFIGSLFKVISIKNRDLKIIGFTFWSTIIQYVVMFNTTIFNWLGAVHFWFVIGLIITLRKIDVRNEN